MNKKTLYTTLPDFLEGQRSSFCWFLQYGIINEFQYYSSITYSTKFNIEIYSQEYFLMKPKYSLIETKNRNYTYSVSLYIPVVFNYLNSLTGNIEKHSINICFGEIPLMTNYGTFIINGYERVVINQIIRSPGLYFTKETNIVNKATIYKAQIIPNFGSWLKFELKPNSIINFNADKSQKLNILLLLNLFKFEKLKINKFINKNILESNLKEMKQYLLNNKYFKLQKFFKTIKTKIHKQHLKNFNNNNRNKFEKTVVSFSLKNIQIQVANLINNFELKSGVLDRILNLKTYELGEIGRFHINTSLNLSKFTYEKNLVFQDIIKIIEKLIQLKELKNNFNEISSIDNLKNKRVRSIGELLQTQIRLSLKNIKSKVLKIKNLGEKNISINEILSKVPIISTLNNFFNTSQLSQFLDQTNLLAQISNLRRITSLGPDGFLGQRVSLSARDIHSSFYGRLCPIETPEGQNAGLISAFSSFARVNSFGYIETPFLKVKNGNIIVNAKPVYLMPNEEKNLIIAPADTLLNNNKILKKEILVRYNGQFIWKNAMEVNFLEVSPLQFLSMTTSLIPFLEHNDANRVLMGASMQRQAVPLLYPMRPIISTGLENQIALNSGLSVLSLTNGYVKEISANFINILNNKKTILYFLLKYEKSNQNTCIHQKPIVWVGESVEIGQILADGPSIDEGELALGQNLLVAYMPWDGYNFEDSILINEHLIEGDLFTSIHINKISVEINESNLGPEKLTKNLENIDSNLLNKLDSNGIIIKNSFVKPNDILVGILKPIQLNEIYENKYLDKLLKPHNKIIYQNISCKVPFDCYGRVLDIQINIYEKYVQEIGLSNNKKSLYNINIYIAQINKLQVGDKLSGRHGNKGIISKILSKNDVPFLPNGKMVDIILNPLGVPSRMNVGQLYEGFLGLAGELLNKRYRIMPFDEIFNANASRILINSALNSARKKTKNNWVFNKNSIGKFVLTDGRSGEKFDNLISVCKSYILKLIHLVDDKIQSRSTGSYSIITQQPLGGRSLQGGQRFGEMEVWALEAFGASYTLQEILTYKSDDILNRNMTKNHILQNTKNIKINLPEAFKVLLMELRALGIEIKFKKFYINKINKKNVFSINLLKNDYNKENIIPSYKSFE